MHDLVENESLYEVRSPAERLSLLHDQLDDSTIFYELFEQHIGQNEEDSSDNDDDDDDDIKDMDVTPQAVCRNPNEAALKFVYKGKELTTSKYVTVYKQRADKKVSGMRNIFRFRVVDDEPQAVNDAVLYELGDFILTKNWRVMEILQLRREKLFVAQAEAKDNMSFIVCYRNAEPGIYHAEPKFTKKNYSNLKDILRTKLVVLQSWKIGERKYVKIADENHFDDYPPDENLDNDNDDDDSSRYCFCRRLDDGDNYIECSNKECSIKWFHLDCVGLKSTEVPHDDWNCPQCLEKDHWCTCGQKDNGHMIGCSGMENCVIEWYHLECVNLFGMPEGDFYCTECVENGTFEIEDGSQYCLCYRSANFDEIVKCSNRGCAVMDYHKCCVQNDGDVWDDWICPACL